MSKLRNMNPTIVDIVRAGSKAESVKFKCKKCGCMWWPMIDPIARDGVFVGGSWQCPKGCAKEIDMNAKGTYQTIKTLETLGYVIVTPEGPKDGGHFGMHTPRTKTSGIQEAFNYAKTRRRDVYIVGGCMPEQLTPGTNYRLEETLKIPWMQDFRLDGGEYNLEYVKSEGAAVIIDSQMSCRYKFGKIISRNSNGPVVHFKPETKGPDNFNCITCSVFEFNVAVGAGGAWPKEGHKGKGIGIFLDSSSGSITHNRIFLIEVVGCDKGVYLKGSGVFSNDIQVIFSHLNNTHLQIGDEESTPTSNRIAMNMSESQGISGSIGADIFGQRNLLTLNVSQTEENKNVVFESEAKDNLIIAMNLSNGITSYAKTPTNKIISCWPIGFNVPTPAFPNSGENVVNTNYYPVEIIILTPGAVSDWTLIDANENSQTVSAKLSAGMRFILGPGDKIKFTYTTVPTWRWKVLR